MKSNNGNCSEKQENMEWVKFERVFIVFLKPKCVRNTKRDRDNSIQIKLGPPLSGGGPSESEKGDDLMRNTNLLTLVASFTLVLIISLFGHTKAFSHCDGMDGPVVTAAQKALETGDVNLVLI
jgi:hypothetical protein